ncbi:MAG: hypothetical protein QMD80_05145 [archaeon]|nr:hypothetical protein [archaeon]
MANDEGEKGSFYALEMIIQEIGDGKAEQEAHRDENSPQEHVSPLYYFLRFLKICLEYLILS